MVRPSYEDTPGAPVVFPAWTFPQLRNLPEGKGGGWVMEQLGKVPEQGDAFTYEALEVTVTETDFGGQKV